MLTILYSFSVHADTRPAVSEEAEMKAGVKNNSSKDSKNRGGRGSSSKGAGSSSSGVGTRKRGSGTACQEEEGGKGNSQNKKRK